MPYCPACGEEYRPGYTECPDCGLPLTEQKPPPPDKGSAFSRVFRTEGTLAWPEGNDGEPERPALLRTYSDRSAFRSALDFLRGMGIPAIDGTDSQNAHLRVYLGSGYMQGGDIYVPETLREDALALLDGKGELVE